MSNPAVDFKYRCCPVTDFYSSTKTYWKHLHPRISGFVLDSVSMSGNPRSRKRKPDQTFKYVQQDSDGIDLTKKAEVKDTGEKDGTAPKPGKHDDSAKDKTDSDADPPPAKKMDEQQKDDKETAPSPIIRKDPFDFLSSTDRKLMETDMLEFVKRFAPSYCVPVYKTWTIPKPQAK